MKVLIISLIFFIFITACQTFQEEDTSHMWWIEDNTVECISGDCDKYNDNDCWCDPEMGDYCGCV